LVDLFFNSVSFVLLGLQMLLYCRYFLYFRTFLYFSAFCPSVISLVHQVLHAQTHKLVLTFLGYCRSKIDSLYYLLPMIKNPPQQGYSLICLSMTTGMSTGFRRFSWTNALDWVKVSKKSQSLYWLGFYPAVKI